MSEITCPKCGSYSITVEWLGGWYSGQQLAKVTCQACNGTGDKLWGADETEDDISDVRPGEHLDQATLRGALDTLRDRWDGQQPTSEAQRRRVERALGLDQP